MRGEIMAAEEEMLADIERNGRLSFDQERTLYNMSLRQDDYGWVPTNMLLSDLEADDKLMGLVERGYFGYDVVNSRGKHAFASLFVTAKGVLYFARFADEIQRRLRVCAVD